MSGAGERHSVRVEACVDSLASALAAAEGGASRVELCADLVEGGTTPSAGMIELCCERVALPVFVIVRPRGGDFLYSELEFEVMRRDVARAVRLGAGGVVLGLLGADGNVDVRRTGVLVEVARPMSVTFHRAFDVCPDPERALDELIGLGVDRVLTSGQAATALEGLSAIAGMVERAAGRIGILAGGGVNEENVRRIVDGTGVAEVHVRGTSMRASGMRHRSATVRFGGRIALSDDLLEVTDAARIAEVVRRVAGAGGAGLPG